MNPQSRNEDIVVQEVFDELVVYDLKRDKVHSLNPTAAFVWQQCDGEKTPEQIATLVQMKYQTDQAEELVLMSLERLGQAHLLEEQVTQGRQVLTRREMLKLATSVGVAVALLPVVKSIVAPTAAHAQTALARCGDGSIAGCVGDPSDPDHCCCCQNDGSVNCRAIQGCSSSGGQCMPAGSTAADCLTMMGLAP